MSAAPEKALRIGPVALLYALWVVISPFATAAALYTIAAVPDGATLYLRSMAVVPAARGSGVGDVILNRATEWAFPTGFDRLTLDTTPFLAAARRLYTRHGFVVVDQAVRDLHGTPLITMTQDLGAIREQARADAS